MKEILWVMTLIFALLIQAANFHQDFHQILLNLSQMSFYCSEFILFIFNLKLLFFSFYFFVKILQIYFKNRNI